MPNITFPSICAPGNAQNGMNLGYLSNRHTKKPHILNWGEGEWMVGAGVGDFANVLQRQDFSRLSEGGEAKALYYTALGLLLGQGVHNLRGVMVGLPVDVFTNDELAKSVMRNIASFLKGEHTFTLNGEQITVNVQSIARCPQPVGAYTTWLNGAKPDGQMWGVLDGGFNTLDAFAVRYPEIVHRYTAGANLGMAEACRHFAKEFKVLTGRECSLQDADTYLHADKPQVTFMGESYDLQQIKVQALESLASRVIAFIRDKWGEPLPFAGVIFAGGQFATLRQHVLKQYPGAFVLENPVVSIAEGLAKQARLLWKEGRVIGLDPGFGAIKGVTL